MTLIEVLVAAVVIGIGLLGIATLQINALQGASNADYRSRATELTAALADRMRANLEGVDLNNYNDNNANAAANCNNQPATICAMTPNTANASGIAECTPTQMAQFDIWEIRCRDGVQTTLPGGQMNIVCTDSDNTDICLPMSPMVITITWQLQSNETTPQTETVVTTLIPGAP
jgi:type IV pilus assembly protein PilV